MSSVKTVFSGAAPLSAAVAQELQKIFPSWVIRQGYGLTETSPIVCNTSEDDVIFGSSGSLLPGVAVKLMSGDNTEITDYDTPGELLVQSPSVVLGYLNNEKANKETFVDEHDGKGHWLRTGDEAVVRRSPGGNEHIYIQERIKELIKVNVRLPPLINCSILSNIMKGFASCTGRVRGASLITPFSRRLCGYWYT